MSAPPSDGDRQLEELVPELAGAKGRTVLPAKTVAACQFAREMRRILMLPSVMSDGKRWCGKIVDELRHAAQIAEELAVLDDESAAEDARGLADRLKALADAFAGQP